MEINFHYDSVGEDIAGAEKDVLKIKDAYNYCKNLQDCVGFTLMRKLIGYKVWPKKKFIYPIPQASQNYATFALKGEIKLYILLYFV